MPHVKLDIKPTLPPGSWVEIQTALGAWDRIARRTGSPGPSEATCRAVDALVAAHAARTPSELSSEIAERPAGVAALEDAVRCRRSITFEYRLPENSALIEHSSQESSARIVVLPRSIEQHKGITYLAGYRKGGSALDRFRIDCIFNAGPVQNRDAEEQIESCARSAKSAKIV